MLLRIFASQNLKPRPPGRAFVLASTPGLLVRLLVRAFSIFTNKKSYSKALFLGPAGFTHLPGLFWIWHALIHTQPAMEASRFLVRNERFGRAYLPSIAMRSPKVGIMSWVFLNYQVIASVSQGNDVSETVRREVMREIEELLRSYMDAENSRRNALSAQIQDILSSLKCVQITVCKALENQQKLEEKLFDYENSVAELNSEIGDMHTTVGQLQMLGAYSRDTIQRVDPLLQQLSRESEELTGAIAIAEGEVQAIAGARVQAHSQTSR